jgi:hypothetical protein
MRAASAGISQNDALESPNLSPALNPEETSIEQPSHEFGHSAGKG